MSAFRNRAIGLLGLSFALTMSAYADVRPRVKITMDPANARPAVSGAVYESELLIRVGASGVLTELQIESDAAWQLIEARIPALGGVERGSELRIPFRARAVDANRPLRVSLMFNGQRVSKALDLSPAYFERAGKPGRVLQIPGSVRGPEPQALRRGGDAGTRGACGGEMIHFQGRVVYRRPQTPSDIDSDGDITGTPLLVPVDGVRVRIRDDDGADPLGDDVLWEGFTDDLGRFDADVCWDDDDLFESGGPDVYVEIIASNGQVTVEDSGVFENDYEWSSEGLPGDIEGTIGTQENFSGNFLDFGDLTPRDIEFAPALHIFNVLYRARREIWEQAQVDVDGVDCQWPEGDSGVSYYDGEIHIYRVSHWAEWVLAHEYWHHVQDQINPDPGGWSYCNGICDDPDCGHCVWCPESAVIAWIEGSADWFAYAGPERTPVRYRDANGNPLTILFPIDLERVFCCGAGPGNALMTEGHIAALLTDIYDGNNDYPTEPCQDVNMNGVCDAGDTLLCDYDGDGMFDANLNECMRDSLALGLGEIVATIAAADPQSPADFIAAFQANFPAHDNAFWRTCNGIGGAAFAQPDTAPPGIVAELASPSHPLGGFGTWPVISITWTAAPDVGSGAAGYSIVWDTQPLEPDFTAELGEVTSAASPPLGLGSYYVSLRARDCVGNWSQEWSSFGPLVIGECNQNGILDACETGFGCGNFPALCGGENCQLSPDCDFDGVPDACEIADGGERDCNGNGTPDDCEGGLSFVEWLGCVDCGCPPSNPNCTPTIDCTWDGAFCWDGQNHTSWSNGGLPGPSDNVCINNMTNGNLVTLTSGTASVRSLGCYNDFRLQGGILDVSESAAFFAPTLLSGGTLRGGADYSFYAPMTITSLSAMEGSGVVYANAGVSAEGNFNRNIARDFVNVGTFALREGGLGISDGAVLSNPAGSLFHIRTTGDSSIFWWTGSQTGTVNNAGTLRKSVGSGTFTVLVPLVSSGAVEVQSGTLNLASSVSGAGSVTAAPGAILRLSGGVQTYDGPVTAAIVQLQSATTSFNGAVNVSEQATVTGGTHSFNHSSTIQNCALVSGSIEGSGQVTVAGLLEIQAGSQYGAGTTLATGTVAFSSVSNRDIGRHFVNRGTATMLSGGLGLSRAAVFENAAGALLDVQAPVSNGFFWWTGAQTGSLLNAGTFRKSVGTQTTTLSVPFTNTGDVDLQTGILDFASTVNSSGTIFGAAGTVLRLSAGTHAYSGSIDVERMEFTGGTTSIAATLNVRGLTTVTGGTHTISAPATIHSCTMSGGTFNGAADLTISGLLRWDGGTHAGTGTTYANGGIQFASGNRDVARHFVNNGAATLTATGLGLSSGALFENAAGALFEIPGSANTSIFWWTGSQTGTLSNAGTFRKAGTGATTVGTPFVNSGQMELRGGALTHSASFTQTGGLLLLDGGSLSKSGAAALEIQGGAVRGAGTITLTGSALNNAGGSMQPGLSAGILTVSGAYTQGAGGELSVELGGLQAGGEHDQLIVSGVANLGGTLRATLIDGFLPQAGDQFVILTYASRSGAFAQLELPAGYAGMVDYGATAAILRITAAPDCFGDLNGDGMVDIQDLANLLAHFGTVSGATMTDGDLDGDGDVDIQDLANLLSRFGTIC